MAIKEWSLGQRMDHIKQMIHLTYYHYLANGKMFLNFYSTEHGSDNNIIEMHYGQSQVSITEKSNTEYLVEYFYYDDGDRKPSELRQPKTIENPLWVINEIQLYIREPVVGY